ncbi:hypothetical protein NKI51_27975 [Mesorhizobium australicum]|uniref:hypothetical protein n=2 Tax=Mesorhizobium australicum TaxID=536018 RepID=UPI0033362BDE
MENLNRRSALKFGLAATAATPVFSLVVPAKAAAPGYSATDGVDMGHGRRMVEVGEQESQITAYKSIKIIDVIYQPGASDPDDQPMMDMDMVCHIIAGEFKIEKKGIPAYTVKDGGIYSCGKGKSDKATNISNVVGIHRIALLIPA